MVAVVEGAELDVLNAFDFDKYKVALLSVEHNHNHEKANAIRAFFKARGCDYVSHYNDDFFLLPGNNKAAGCGY
jgi:hypothetical protein